jgi:hypothetical protein
VVWVEGNFRDDVQGHLEPPITQERVPCYRICGVPEVARSERLEVKGCPGGLRMATTESLFQDPGGALHCIWRSSVFGVCPLILSLAADLAEELKR